MVATRTVRLAPPYEDLQGFRLAVDTLRQGGLVAFPTESFYGLAADAFNEDALRQLFAAKGRDPGQPLLVLIHTADEVERLAMHVSPLARRLMRAFWPGGVTLVFEARPSLSALLTAGTGKIGIRLSSHPLAVALPRALGRPITGTSANPSGEAPCTDAPSVEAALSGRVDLILDGGRTDGKAPSTVVDVCGPCPEILREGIIGRERIFTACLGEDAQVGDRNSEE